MNNWYNNLKKSDLNPPKAVFGPVWFILYTLIIASFIIYISTKKYTRNGIIFFILKMILNILWPILFFNKRLICVSLILIIIMDIFVYLTYFEFRKSSNLAANLLLPYMIWIILATYLNFYICINN